MVLNLKLFNQRKIDKYLFSHNALSLCDFVCVKEFAFALLTLVQYITA